MMLLRSVTMALAAFLMTMSRSAAHAQLAYVPNKLQICGPVYMSGGSTAYGDWLRGEGYRTAGLGQMYSGMGIYLQGLGDYEISHQRARSIGLQNDQVAKDNYKQTKKRNAQDIEVAKQTNLEHNLKKFWSENRDRPTVNHVCSGQTLNLLLKDLVGRLGAADFANLRFTQEELSDIRLATAHDMTRRRVFELLDESGAVRWPTSLCGQEFRKLRAAVDETARNLMAAEPGSALGKSLLSKWDAEVKSLRGGIGILTKSSHQAWYEAKHFIDGLQTLSQCMRTDEFVQVFNGTLDVVPQSLPELIQFMSQHRLRFAASNRDSSAVYLELHRVLAERHRRIVPSSGKNRS